MLYTIVNFTTQYGKHRHTDIANFATLIHTKKIIHCVAIFTILYSNYYPSHGKFKRICIRKFARRLEWISLNSIGKIAMGVNKISFTMLYGNYCYIIIENFPKKFSPCIIHCNWNIVETFLSNIAKYFIATSQFQLSEIILKTNKYLILLKIL